jgi:hypothetical protein
VPKLLDQTRDRIITRHHSIRTEATYLRLDWIERVERAKKSIRLPVVFT